MVCLYCGKKLPIVKKLTAEEFCSVAHRRAFHAEQEQLAVASLLEQQQRMRPYRSQSALEPPAVQETPLSPKTSVLSSRGGAESIWQGAAPLAAAILPLEPTTNLSPAPVRNGLAAPQSGVQLFEPRGCVGVEEAMQALSLSQMLLPPSPLPVPTEQADKCWMPAALEEFTSVSIAARFLKTASGQASLPELPMPGVMALPHLDLHPESPAVPEEVDFDMDLGESACLALLPGCAVRPPDRLPVASAKGLQRLGAILLPVGNGQCLSQTRPAFASVLEPQALVGAAGLAEVRDCSTGPLRAEAPVQIDSGFLALASLEWNALAEDLALPIEAKRSPFAPPASQNAAVSGAPVHPVRTSAPLARAVSLGGAVPRFFSRPKAVAPREANLLSAESVPFAAPPVAIAAARETNARGLDWGTLGGRFETELLPLPSVVLAPRGLPPIGLEASCSALPTKGRIVGLRRSSLCVLPPVLARAKLVPVPVAPLLRPLRPRLHEAVRLENFTILLPRLSLSIQQSKEIHSPFAALSQLAGGTSDLSWSRLKKSWQEAPNDLRWIAVVIPIVIGLIWLANSPGAKGNLKLSVRNQLSSLAPNVGELVQSALKEDSLASFRQGIQRRAAIELSDDFRQGLGEWSGKGDWARGWRYDPAGFLRPRQLALYTPSLGLEDYRFEFLGAIEQKALSWVFRAADLRNYYVSRLELTRPGPIPTVELVRYAVLDGKAGPRKVIPLPFQGRMDTIYRVRLDVNGSDFVTTVQGQVVDVFTDARLARGGIGFYADAGEDARLRWVEVSHQYDFLGRLCAFLVPYNISNSTVRSAP
ncbi:hypothetical protein [Bryobacter aggregatus]|uniref:hypothetical protein n=1 Tax=Bryobacter aggregatus TaxID=360054 RepID=UPI0004E1F1A9|nr:hypothetical protein [Bryobacter aggregatus]